VWPDGSVHVIFGRATVVRDESGEALRVYGTNVDITERKQAEEQIRQYATRLQTLSKQLLVAQEAERRAIARELHDEIGQQLTALGLILSSEHPSPDQLSHADAIVRDLMDRLHDLSLDLRPTILDDMGLIPALVWLFERYTALTGVRVRFEHSGLEEQRFESELETTAYRIIQEALTNVARHADVRDVTVRLWTDDDATLSVMIVDAGRGFDPQMIDTRATSGLAGMQERVGLLGGDVTIESADGEGTRLTVILPLHSDSGLPGEEQSL
jgi:signal transduction histidine kinase